MCQARGEDEPADVMWGGEGKGGQWAAGWGAATVREVTDPTVSHCLEHTAATSSQL